MQKTYLHSGKQLITVTSYNRLYVIACHAQLSIRQSHRTNKRVHMYKVAAQRRPDACETASPNLVVNSGAAGMPPRIAPADNVNHLLCGEPLPIVFFYPPTENKWAAQLAVWLRC